MCQLSVLILSKDFHLPNCDHIQIHSCRLLFVIGLDEPSASPDFSGSGQANAQHMSTGHDSEVGLHVLSRSEM